MIKNRNGEIITTNERQNNCLKLLYETFGGRALLKILTVPAVSRLVGAFMDSPLSKPLIEPFIKKCKIDISQYETDGIRTYNEFFTRKIKSGMRSIDMHKYDLISPCDSKLSVYKIFKHSVFKIKDSYYRVRDLVDNKSLANEFVGGYCLIFRLEVNDYHRYIYIDNGSKERNFFIPGMLHTVNPIALDHVNIYKRNSREYTVLYTDNFGELVQVEVGAMMVGRISNHHQRYDFRRGEEKGMFQFGGSTIVLLIKKNYVLIDKDILENSAAGFETAVKLGEKIGQRVRSRKPKIIRKNYMLENAIKRLAES